MQIFLVIHIDTNDSDVNIAGCFSNREKVEAFIDEMEKTRKQLISPVGLGLSRLFS